MRYFPLSENGGLILNDEDLPLTIQHDPDTEVMTWVFGQGKPTIFNARAAEDYIRLIEGYPEWIHKPHPKNLAECEYKASLTPFSKKRMPEPGSITTPFDAMLADGWEQLLKKDEPTPLTGYDEKRGEAI